jgi:hypothetical protein
MTQCRAVVTVTDSDSGAPVRAAECEIVGIDKGKTGANGAWTSCSFAPGPYNVKVRIKDYGPTVAGRPTVPGEYAELHAFGGGDEPIAICLTNLKSARAFVWVVEAASNRPLSGAQVEIVGRYLDTTDASGEAVSCQMAPGRYHLKTRLDGYGPAAQPLVAGETDRVVELRKGDQAFIVPMANANWSGPPAPSSEAVDHSQLRIIPPASSVMYPMTADVVFDYTSATWNVESKWTLFAPDGTAVDTSRDLGGGKYKLTQSTLAAYFATAGNAVFGTWTLRYEKDAFYDDCFFVVWTPPPDTGVTPVAPPAPPSSPPGSLPAPAADFIPDGLNPDRPTAVTYEQLARCYVWGWQQKTGAALTRTTMLILMAQWHVETGGKPEGMHWYNLTNIKKGKRKHAYTQFTCDEYLSDNGVAALQNGSTPTAEYDIPTTPDGGYTRNGEGRIRVFFHPPNAATSFLAYGTLEDAMLDYLTLIQTRYGTAMDAAVNGDIDGFAQGLRDHGFYTASEASYASLLRARYKVCDSKVPQGIGA